MNNVRSSYTHLQDKAEYEKRYDRLTVDECRRYKQISLNLKVNDEKRKKLKVYPKTAVEVVSKIHLYFVTGERYLEREPTIQKWMDSDREKDEVLNKAIVPSDVRCDACHISMQPESRMLDHTSESLKVMFMFRCQNGCNLGKVVYEDGSIWENPSSRCPHCKTKLVDHTKRTKYKIIMSDSCPSCDYVQNSEIDLREKKEAVDPHFEEDRKLYCLSAKDGEEYRASSWNRKNITRLGEEMEEREKKEKDPAFQKVKQLKKLTIVELEKLLLISTNKKDYIKLRLGEPDMGRYVTVPFTVQEVHRKANDRESNSIFKKIVDKALESTNWRLMSEGISYRLGILSGRLKAYEKEEDLINLYKNE